MYRISVGLSREIGRVIKQLRRSNGKLGGPKPDAILGRLGFWVFFRHFNGFAFLLNRGIIFIISDKYEPFRGPMTGGLKSFIVQSLG